MSAGHPCSRRPAAGWQPALPAAAAPPGHLWKSVCQGIRETVTERASLEKCKLHLPDMKTYSETSSTMMTTAKKEVIALALQLVRDRAGIGTSASNSRTQSSQGSSPHFSYSAHPFSNCFSVLVEVGSKPEHYQPSFPLAHSLPPDSL